MKKKQQQQIYKNKNLIFTNVSLLKITIVKRGQQQIGNKKRQGIL